MYSFGNNHRGQCGILNNETNIRNPVKVLNNPNIESVILGSVFSFYLESKFFE